MFLEFDGRRATFREYLFEGPLLLKPLVFLIALVVKIFRVRLPGSSDLPPVKSLKPFVVSVDSLSTEFLQSLLPVLEELQLRGFRTINGFAINDVRHNTRYASVLMLSTNGETLAWVRQRIWPNLSARSRNVRVNFFTRANQQLSIVTTSANRDVLDPPQWDAEYLERTPASVLFEHHQEHVREKLGTARAVSYASDQALDALESLHQEFIAYQMGRGVFVETTNPDSSAAATDPPSTAPIADPTTVAAQLPLAPTASTDDALAPLIAEVRRIERHNTQWFSKLLFLVISVGLFVGLGAGAWGWEILALLVPILFVHELGHWIAMKAFGYRNIRMFFIPFLGAAVTGRHIHVPSWKKAMVYLAGPLPSIVISLVVGVLGAMWQYEILQKACLFGLILNVLNLIPLMPLDGGWVAHLTLFSRSILLDTVVRAATGGLLILGSFLTGDRAIFYIGLFLLISLPAHWRMSQISEQLRQSDLAPATGDEIPEEAIRQIAMEVQESKIKVPSVKQMAKVTMSVYDLWSTRPPSWPATIGIWSLHGGGFAAALVGGLIVMSIAHFQNRAQRWTWDDLEQTQESVALDTTDPQFALGTVPQQAQTLLFWECADRAAAQDAFERLRQERPVTVTRLNNVLLTSDATRVAEPPPLDPSSPYSGIVERKLQSERDADQDPRLEDLKVVSLRRRAFDTNHGETPYLNVAFDRKDQRDAVVKLIRETPRPYANHAPLPPWCPQLALTDEQVRMRRLLRILDGSEESPPWILPVNRSSVDWDGYSEKRQRIAIRKSTARMQLAEKRRGLWLEEAKKRAKGNLLGLLNAFEEFEKTRTQSENDTDDEALNTQVEPEVDLEPYFPALGYVDDSSPLHRYCAIAYARVAENENQQPATADAEKDSGPQDSAKPTYEIDIHLSSMDDPAAAFAGLIGWLRRQGATSFELVYWRQQLKDPSSEP